MTTLRWYNVATVIVTIEEAKERLDELLLSGEEVVIRRDKITLGRQMPTVTMTEAFSNDIGSIIAASRANPKRMVTYDELYKNTLYDESSANMTNEQIDAALIGEFTRTYRFGDDQ